MTVLYYMYLYYVLVGIYVGEILGINKYATANKDSVSSGM